MAEDHPDARTEAEHNYRRTLDLLARASVGRGGALGPESLAAALPEDELQLEVYESFDNETTVVDPARPLRWLRELGGLDPVGLDELDRLDEDVRRQGMAYGRAWFGVVRVRPRASGTGERSS